MNRENRLQSLADRLDNFTKKVEAGEVEITEEVTDLVGQLDHLITEYENILDKE